MKHQHSVHVLLGMVGTGSCIWASVPATRVRFPRGQASLSPHMGWLVVPLEQDESSSALVLTDMVVNPQPTNNHVLFQI